MNHNYLLYLIGSSMTRCFQLLLRINIHCFCVHRILLPSVLEEVLRVGKEKKSLLKTMETGCQISFCNTDLQLVAFKGFLMQL